MKHIRIALLGLLFLGQMVSVQAQSQPDPILFSVDNDQVPVSEFVYIYTKTNGQKADFGRPSLSEYLDLYKKFKMKVRRAREMKLDTIPSLKNELAGYRKQLASNYLIDKEVTNQLIQEAYTRTQEDVRISHILVKLDANASPEDTIIARKKIMEAQKMLASGKNFLEVCRTFSEDETTASNGGDLGFWTALFPSGFYSMETAAYQTPVGKVSGVIRTKLGYHLIRVTERRPARGEIEVAHILVRKIKGDHSADARTKIDSIYYALKAGASFEDLAKEFSEDKLSASKGGNIGFFGINRYESAFEEAAFGLFEDGSYTKPFETSSGYHIVKRISKRGVDAEDLAKRRLEPLVKRDERFELAKTSMIEKIKSEIGVQVQLDVLNKYTQMQNDSFYTFLWRPSSGRLSTKTILKLGKSREIPVSEFEDFLLKNAGKRVNQKRSNDLVSGIHVLFDEFTKDECIKYEESQLEDKYPDFKALMREYEEGILLFEATKRVVWDRAGQDTIGLEKYFANEAKDRYQWGERARVTYYTVKSSDINLLEDVRKYTKGQSSEKVLKKFNKGNEPVVSARELIYEHGKNPAVDEMVWEPGSLSYNEEDKRSKGWNFMKIEEVLPPAPKTLDEARGYVIADYQDKLEKDWILELKARYNVNVNQQVFESLIK
ncbi:MAG: peptidylprolyl isomerase [Saprospiraceae bacterium]|nr:peptidylprolyl isomerase [Saprospiraceae bacterium]